MLWSTEAPERIVFTWAVGHCWGRHVRVMEFSQLVMELAVLAIYQGGSRRAVKGHVPYFSTATSRSSCKVQCSCGNNILRIATESHQYLGFTEMSAQHQQATHALHAPCANLTCPTCLTTPHATLLSQGHPVGRDHTEQTELEIENEMRTFFRHYFTHSRYISSTSAPLDALNLRNQGVDLDR